MKINFLFVATLAASAFASPVVGNVAERQVSPGLDGLVNGLTTVVSDIVHGLYDALNGILEDININSASITDTQEKIAKGEISKEDGDAKIQVLIKELQEDFAKGAAQLQGTTEKLDIGA